MEYGTPIYWIVFSLCVLCSYLLGSISFARIYSKFVKKDDITKHHSGNPGSVNMMRTYGIKAFFFTFFLDVLKTIVPALVGKLVFGDFEMFVFGIVAVLGHVFPVYHKFRGGKAIASSLGVFVVATPYVAVAVMAVMLIAILTFGYGSIVSLLGIAVMCCILSIKFAGDISILICLCFIFVLTWVLHHSNIVKMLTGTENKSNFKSILEKLRKKRQATETERKEG